MRVHILNMKNMKNIFFIVAIFLINDCVSQSFKAFNRFADPQHEVLCNASYYPPFCELPNVPLSILGTVEDFERCAPAVLQIPGRNYFWGAAGRKLTYYRNIKAYDKIEIVPQNLRDVSGADISTTILGQYVSMPIGLAPAAAQNLAVDDGEIKSARAATGLGTVTILSSLATTSLEDVASAVFQMRVNIPPVLWMQVYIYRDRSETLSIVKRAEKNGYKAIVVTCDAPFLATLTCNAGTVLAGLRIPNLYNGIYKSSKIDPAATFEDITWLSRNTILPIVAKGILNGEDAIRAIKAGASAILVSNHGGRQLDTDPPTIEALTDVVTKVNAQFPAVEVYLDGGIRNGGHAFKALARGARAVFIGRPQLWGLAIAGELGVNRVLTILKQEFNETMMLAGINSPTKITKNNILPDRSEYDFFK